nr:hypothetical protein [Tanacetum cinerariifolium]
MVIGERTDAWFIKGLMHIVPGKLEQRGSAALSLSRDTKTECGGPSYVKAHDRVDLSLVKLYNLEECRVTMNSSPSCQWRCHITGYRVGGDLLSPSSIYQFM